MLFEVFSRHEALGWPSAYTEWFPRSPWLNAVRRVLDNRLIHLAGRKGGPHNRTMVGNRLLPQPAEAYGFWDLNATKDFSRSFLLERTAARESVMRTRAAVRKLLKWQGRPRFAAKITGPSRIRFLDSIFPDARFVHVVRDGRAAVHSVLNVDFWREKGGFEQPFWTGGLSQEDLRLWQADSKEPGALAALQWKRILEVARLESASIEPTRYQEIRYEDFVESPHASLSKLYEFCDLDDSPASHKSLEDGPVLRNFNDRYRADFSDSYVEKLSDLMQPMLSDFGYGDSDR